MTDLHSGVSLERDQQKWKRLCVRSHSSVSGGRPVRPSRTGWHSLP